MTLNSMKILSTLVFFFFAITLSRGQSDTVFIKYNKDKFEEKLTYKTDTIVFDTPNDRQILYGTDVLPSTYNQQVAKGFGLFLNQIEFTPCKQILQPILIGEEEIIEEPEIIEVDSIISIIKTDTLWTFALKIFENCCHSFLCDISIESDSILNLIFYSYGANYCSCDCCFGLNYKIERLNFEDNTKIKFVMINGNIKSKKKI